jgi:membrane-bound lytic murein transglycosylase MltF
LLAHESGLNPDKWFDNVEVAMRQMTRSYTVSAAGCRCGQAIIYVRAIRSLYYAYRNQVLAVKTPQQAAHPQPTRRRLLPARKT